LKKRREEKRKGCWEFAEEGRWVLEKKKIRGGDLHPPETLATGRFWGPGKNTWQIHEKKSGPKGEPTP